MYRPYLDEETGQTAGVIALIRDITERKTAEQQIVSAAKKTVEED